MSVTTQASLQQIAALAAQLARADRLQLVERIVHELAMHPDTEKPGRPIDWMSLRAIAPDLLDGEDAQVWVSRTSEDSSANLVWGMRCGHFANHSR
jgi:hypothetical protein